MKMPVAAARAVALHTLLLLLVLGGGAVHNCEAFSIGSCKNVIDGRRCGYFAFPNSWSLPSSQFSSRTTMARSTPCTITTLRRRAGILDDEQEQDDEDINTTIENDGDNDGDVDSKQLYTFEEVSSDPELFQAEQEASRRVSDRMLLPDRINKVMTATAWLFVIAGIVLQQIGYGFVVDPDTHMITIDTLEHRAFLLELTNNKN